MLPPYLAEQFGNWAAEFAASDAASRDFPEEALAHAPALMAGLLTSACARTGGGLEALSAPYLQAAFLQDLVLQPIPEAVRPHVPWMAAAFLAQLEDAGRLAGGRELGKRLAAATPAWLDAAAGKQQPIRRPGSKIGRNDPCPCGSGRKYKACCL